MGKKLQVWEIVGEWENEKSGKGREKEMEGNRVLD
jgi:hypothetical protein